MITYFRHLLSLFDTVINGHPQAVYYIIVITTG